MNRGKSTFLLALALLVVMPACASRDGVNSAVDINPVNGPILNQVVPARDAAIDTTAQVASEVLDVLLEPIRFVFDATSPGYNFQNLSTTQVPLTPADRLEMRRTYLGLPSSAEARIAARQSLMRTRLAQQNATQRQKRYPAR